MLSVTCSVSHQLGYPAWSAARLIAAWSQSGSNSKSCPESARRYGNSSLNATMIHLICWKQLALVRVWFRSFAERVDRINKLIDIFESPMNGRVTKIRHFVDPAQFFQNFRADRGGLDFASTGFEIVHDFID